jgi:hypothetical protein
MKISSLIIPSALALVMLAACEEESRPRNRQNSAAQSGSNNYGYQAATPGTATDFVTEATPTPTPAVTTTTDMAPTPTPAPAASGAPTERNLPYGTPVAGKPGFVTSPHAPYAGYVDVRGFPPNTEVKDPYSGKIFLVP